MKSVSTAVVIAVAAFLAVAPASAYEVDLTTWNTSQIQPSVGACSPLGTCDYVKVLIGTDTIEFIYVAGSTSPGTFKDMLDISWAFTLPVSTSNDGNYSSRNILIDGFNLSNGYFSLAANVVTWGNHSNNQISDVTFSFAPNSVPLSLSANDFVVHVQYEGGCSGFVGGPGNGGIIGNSSNPSCTPVPEPITMFLGGTGLLVMGYIARKRLFGMGRSLAV